MGGIAQDARHLARPLRWFCARALRRHQHEDEIDRSPSSESKSTGLSSAREQADEPRQALELAVRNGDAAADTGRAQPLALQQRVEMTRPAGRKRPQPAPRSPPGALSCSQPQAGHDGLLREHVSQRHVAFALRDALLRSPGAKRHASPYSMRYYTLRSSMSIQPIEPSDRSWRMLIRSVPPLRNTKLASFLRIPSARSRPAS